MRQCANMPMCKCANYIKKIALTLTIFFTVNFLHAQTVDEWLKQKETQIKYLIEQIGVLKAYGEVVNKGYYIAHNGLSNVFNSKDGDYYQHSDYFLSLWKVKPDIRSYSKVFSIYKMKAAVEKRSQLIKSSAIELLSDKERGYINSVYSNLLNECNDLISEMEMCTTDDQLQLKDDERIRRIDKVYFEMQDRYAFSQSFANEIRLLLMNRLKEANGINKLSSLYEIK